MLDARGKSPGGADLSKGMANAQNLPNLGLDRTTANVEVPFHVEMEGHFLPARIWLGWGLYPSP